MKITDLIENFFQIDFFNEFFLLTFFLFEW